MTRWARGGTANKKKPLEASSWSEMSSAGKSTDPKSTGESKKKRKREEGAAKDDEHSEKKRVKHSIAQKSSTSSNSTLPTKPKIDVLYELMKEDEGERKVELLEHVRKDKRREARRVKRGDVRQNSRICFNCRLTGHDIANCPKVVDDVECGTGICFKCGSTEHAVAQCKASVSAGRFPFAKCFICGEQGHLSRNCPDNPRGLYPNGGCCKLCESVEHFQKDCPTQQKMQETVEMKLTTLKHCVSLDDDDAVLNLLRKDVPSSSKKHKPKVVKF